MRTQVATVGLLGVWAAGLGLVAGCDNITAGQTTDSNAPPQLLHVMIQDAESLGGFPNRASAVDLIDYYAPPACHIYGQDAKGNNIDDCLTQFEVDGQFPDFSCKPSSAGSTDGICGDPFQVPSTGVPIPLSAAMFGSPPETDPMGDPGGGVQIRLVFDKVLDNSIENVNPTATPKTYALKPGIVELDDPSGKAVDSVMFLDNAGSPLFSSDLELIPLGPAVVIKPKSVLDPGTTYTIKILNPGALKDREGNAAVGANMTALQTTWKFTTESLTAAAQGTLGSGIDYPDTSKAGATCKSNDPLACTKTGATMPSTTLSCHDLGKGDNSGTCVNIIAPNEVVQIGFYGSIAGDAAMLSTKDSTTPAGAKPIFFSDRGSDPAMCAKNAGGMTSDPNGFILDIANGSTASNVTAMPVDWPAGFYDLVFTVGAANSTSTSMGEIMFQVAGTDVTDPTKDPNIAGSGGHVFPSQCTM